MKFDRRNRKVWQFGERVPFRLSKDGCQKLLLALARCHGHIIEQHCMEVDLSTGEVEYDLKPHQMAVLYLLSLPIGSEELFESIVGKDTLEEPPKITGQHLNTSGENQPDENSLVEVDSMEDLLKFVIKKTKEMSPEEFRAQLTKIGVIDESGELTPPYRQTSKRSGK